MDIICDVCVCVGGGDLFGYNKTIIGVRVFSDMIVIALGAVNITFGFACTQQFYVHTNYISHI